MVFANGLVFFTHVGKVWIAKVENAAFGTLLYRAFDVILTFFAQFIFFEVKINTITLNALFINSMYLPLHRNPLVCTASLEPS